MSDGPKTTYAIHPAIGVARMGNLDFYLTDETTYYMGPEAPYETPNEGKPYKVSGLVKKQVQRFRIYEYEDGVAKREVTLSEDDIKTIIWTVNVANRKPALDISDAAAGTISAPTHRPPDFHPSITRNAHVKDPEHRKAMCNMPGPVSCGPDNDLAPSFTDEVYMFPKGYDPNEAPPPSTTVDLGWASTEPDTGRLLVFPAYGLSEGATAGKYWFSQTAPLGANGNDFANNDNWYDQTGDGPVTAAITFKDGTTIHLDQPEQRAWLLLVLPKYAPGMNYFTNLQHVALSAVHQGPAPRPSFADDIFPILRSVSQLQWVSDRGSLGHGTHRQGYYLSQQRLKLLSDNDTDPASDAYKARHGIFSRIRDPNTLPARPTDKSKPQAPAEVGPRAMPQLPGDVMRTVASDTLNKHDWALPSVTKLQYAMLKHWRDGNFDPDPDGIYDYQPLESYDIADQPAALDRAAVEGTCGTPFYPGIESWNVMQLPELYAAPMRIAADVQPGDLTMGNALPWQSDYLDCSDGWWPVQRPNHVTRDGKPLQPWAPNAWFPPSGEKYDEMVQHWSRLGFVITQNGGATYEEQERDPGLPE